MLKAQIYSLKGTKLEEMELPSEVFGQKINLNLLAQANYVYEERSHTGLRNTKTRSEINRTTKKVYKQKGTGGARHGSRRANVFVGGGVVFGPRPVRRILTLPQALRKSALVSSFSAKAKSKEVIVIRGISEVKKTKEAGDFVKKVSEELKNKRFTFALSDNLAFRFLRNLKNVKTVLYKDISAFDVLTSGILVVDEKLFKTDKKVEKVEKKVPAKKVVKKVVEK
jgi:large subunit ribosomal protein L4